MNVYIDSSAFLRIVLSEPDPIPMWDDVRAAFSSELIRLECLRTIDRARIVRGLPDEEIASRRGAILRELSTLDVISLDSTVLRQAEQPLPTTIGTLDSIHLATAMLLRSMHEDLEFATHDVELATAARALGFTVHGAP